MKDRQRDLHRLDGVVGMLYGLNLHILDGVWEQELVDDVNLVLVERSDGSECVHGLDKRLDESAEYGVGKPIIGV